MPDDKPVVGTDLTIPPRVVARVPMISAESYSHLGRFGGALVLSAFEQIGGLDRLASWADSNPTDFFTKLFPKLIARTAQVDVSGTLTIDDTIARLERQEEIIDAEFQEMNYDL